MPASMENWVPHPATLTWNHKSVSDRAVKNVGILKCSSSSFLQRRAFPFLSFPLKKKAWLGYDKCIWGSKHKH